MTRERGGHLVNGRLWDTGIDWVRVSTGLGIRMGVLEPDAYEISTSLWSPGRAYDRVRYLWRPFDTFEV
jgi:hypothetical protein